MFQRIAIINRGEAAMRLIHAVKDLNAENPTQPPVTTIALYTDVERTAMFTKEADEAYPLGPADARPYLNHDLLIDTLTSVRADAVWVGWGFVAEDATFADRLEAADITFIGPSGDAMRQLGDKIGSKKLAESVGVPVAPWSDGEVASLEDALAAADRIGYPLMLKASAGGGGRGIRRVDQPADLEEAYQRTKDEAERAFGSGVVFLEKLVTGARHVEVQLIADGTDAWALGVRDCTVQRRNQKVIEESSSPLLGADKTSELRASAERLAQAVGYSGAGTVEFLYHPGQDFFAFLEVNTRLQVEHPITEVTCSFDLVKAQLRVAAGEPLGERPTQFGHAIEARLNAEDPDRDFAPAPGRITRLTLPCGPGIRVDTGVAEGDTIPSDFDSMIAKIIAFGATRDEALGRLRRAIDETCVIIAGGATNKSFIAELLNAPAVIGAPDVPWADTGWIDRERAKGGLNPTAHSGISLVVAAIEAYCEAERLEVARLVETAHGGRPQANHQPVQVDLKLRGVTYQLTAFRLGETTFRVRSGDHVANVEVMRLDDVHARLRVNGTSFKVTSATHGPVHFVEVDGVAHRISRDEGGVVRSPAPALVVATPVSVGDVVEAGAPIVVLESMKMETVIPAPFSGRVKDVLVMTGHQVETMAALVSLEPLGAEDESSESATIILPPPAEATADELRAELVAHLLGYDIDDASQTLHRYLEVRSQGESLAAEVELFGVFADLAELSRNRGLIEPEHTELRIHSPAEYFHTYLRSLDVQRAHLPEAFTARLGRALAHYGIDELDRTNVLEAAMFRVFTAQQRLTSDLDIIIALLSAWSTEPAPTLDNKEAARAQLERLVRVTQRRFSSVSDLARSVRFRWFDEPMVDAERTQLLADVRADIDYIKNHPTCVDYAERLNHLANVPERIVSFLGESLDTGISAHEPVLEALVHKHYAAYGLHDVAVSTWDGRASVCASYVLENTPIRTITSIGNANDLLPGGPLEALVVANMADAASDHDIAVELYIAGSAEELFASALEAVSGWTLPGRVRRIVIAACENGKDDADYMTLRQSGDRFVEDERLRGLHPMILRRIDLWRLSEFNIKRLPAPSGVLLFDCSAISNPDDRRLVAMAEVSSLALVRNQDDQIIAIPHVERAVENCFEAIRRTRTSAGRAGTRLDHNHVWVHVWPTIDFDPAEALPLQSKISPLSDGAGVDEVAIKASVRRPGHDASDLMVRFRSGLGAGVASSIETPPTEPLKPLDEYSNKVLRARRRGLVYPYELSETLAGPGGTLTELELDDARRLRPTKRRPGQNDAGIIVAKVTTPTKLHPEGITRIVLSGDPTKGLGAVAEPECARIIAAIDLAEEMGVPLEWYTLSSGARISMTSGVENMDWVGAALARIVRFTQDGGEINVVVAGINVGAQPYWNAEATMLMHTKGILIMTPDSAMVLTGKQSLDFSGGVSAEDNFGIGGYDRVMGPNGQAQYWAANLAQAFEILLHHYDATVLDEDGPRRAPTTDPTQRDVCDFPHHLEGSEFTTVGQIFSPTHNPDRKKPFDIRTVIQAVCDTDHPRLERWATMADAETAVVVDARLGGFSACVIGIESHPVARAGFPPTDGPDTYTAGTLFPRSSKKVARAINACSGNRPVVVLANLSGFDGSPESMRNLQLEYGAEIGRAIVNFSGPIIFVVISRYHGGAFVVFSKQLNKDMTVLAVDGSFASVIGGAPAAAVVFARDVSQRSATDPRVTALEARAKKASPTQRLGVEAELATMRAVVRAEKISEVAAEFDGIHSIQRAVEVGSVDRVIQACELRQAIISVIERKRHRNEG